MAIKKIHADVRGKTLLSSVSIVPGATDITFTSIPDQYTDLEVVTSNFTQSATNSADAVIVRFNGDSTAGNYRWAQTSTNPTSTETAHSGATSTAFGTQTQRTLSFIAASTAYDGATSIMTIKNYKGTQKKSIIAFTYTGSVLTFTGFSIGTYTPSSAISSISFTRVGTYTFQSGVVELWGIA